MASSTSSVSACFCGRRYASLIDLEEHRRARGHFPSHVCGPRCKHELVSEDLGKSQEPGTCGTCSKICDRPDILNDHRVVTGHCYCSDCNRPFKSQSAFDAHRQTEIHASEFTCCDCDISFKDIHALNAHMARPAHHKSLPQNPPQQIKKLAPKLAKNEVCIQCERKFRSTQALLQHQKSVHRPNKRKSAVQLNRSRACLQCQRTFGSTPALSQHQQAMHRPIELKCPMKKGCRGSFSSVSSLVQHLESGSCRSGMNRDEIFRIVQSCDSDRIIHKLPELSPSDIPASTTFELSTASNIEAGSFDSESEWSVIATPASERTVDETLEGWLLLGDGQESTGKELPLSRVQLSSLWCSLCPQNSRKFSSVKALQQHMESPVHCPKIYRCPSNLFTVPSSSQTKTTNKKAKEFSTLGSLTQHLESGSCYRGRNLFFSSMEAIQKRLNQLGFGRIALLLPGHGSS